MEISKADPEILHKFISEIPKTDLHVHLDGSIRIDTLIELAKEKSIHLPSYNPQELHRLVFKSNFVHLEEYLDCFQYTDAVMQDQNSLERISYEFAYDNYSEGVRYFEVRFAPQLHASVNANDNFSMRDVIHCVNSGLSRATNEFNSRRIDNEPEYAYGIIASALRMFTSHMGRYYDALCSVHPSASQDQLAGYASESLVRVVTACRYEDGIPVIALDIAGAEEGYKNNTHIQAFDIAHNKFLNKTVHAGESYGPESIFQAVRDLHAERIGHGFHLFSQHMVHGAANSSDSDGYVKRLTKYICDRRICIEVCLTSNLNTMPNLKLENHTFRKMIEQNVCVCINTDNRLVSNTNTTQELIKAITTFNLSNNKLKEVVMNGYHCSFYHGTYGERLNYIAHISQWYDKIAEKYGFA